MKFIIVAAHLRGMWPAPSTDKDILTPNEKLKTLNTTNQTHNYIFLDYVKPLCIYTDTYVIRIHKKCTEILTDPN